MIFRIAMLMAVVLIGVFLAAYFLIILPKIERAEREKAREEEIERQTEIEREAALKELDESQTLKAEESSETESNL